jgi:pyruvate/2-oxoglutarate/acetoin dehydrogenase E1 component/TPP-dependent pyruvate/acetoin dehydrogenase alpha subunit
MNEKTNAQEAGEREAQFVEEVLNDYRICCISREASLLARKEVLTGKAKFGIIGDGKEVPQVAMARVFQKGDFRAGYYRDQTLMFALGLCTVEQFFAQLYADPENDPFSGGRQMNNHFATPLIDSEGKWNSHKNLYNVSADISPTAGQMARALGLAQASGVYRNNAHLGEQEFSEDGNEVCFCTIGDASTSEGVFWETVNAATVMQVPLAISVWDDGYGISVPRKYQTARDSISKALEGFRGDGEEQGLDIYVVKAWDYPALCEIYEKGIERMRRTHRPALFHVEEVTQPQGHSTSGSHERYKSAERLEWEKSHDCILIMRQWMIESGIATAEQLDHVEHDAIEEVRNGKERAWKAYTDPIGALHNELRQLYDGILAAGLGGEMLMGLKKSVDQMRNPLRYELVRSARRAGFALSGHESEPAVSRLAAWLEDQTNEAAGHYHTHVHSHSADSALSVEVVPASYSESSPTLNGFQILNACFDHALASRPEVIAFGEDVGQIGGVNQGFAGMQEKYGGNRVFDTGIREWTIIGQAIGMAMRGLRPIAEIQYLDYLLYGLTPLSDDLASLRYRSDGQQKAPVIVRTRGHRLEGIWHTGSPIGMLLGALRGIYLITPRNMTQAAGFYNTMLRSDDPAVIIECLNGYRLKEKLPDNIGEFTLPLGVPDVIREGTDVTLVTYGSCVRIAEEACALLDEYGISVELIDPQTLLPFDLHHRIVESVKKTGRVVFLDEDMPGGGTAYMMQEVLERQGGYRYLDSPPVTIAARPHRPPYGSDGDYFCKPQAEDVFDAIHRTMKEANPARWK